MKKTIVSLVATLTLSAIIGACGGGSSSAPPVQQPPPPPPPPPAAEDPGGIWTGQSNAVAAADVSTSFEFNATGGFSVGTAPYTADFSDGNAETRGNPALYVTGANAWHVLSGTSATVTFETNPNTLSLWVRTQAAGDVAQVRVLDDAGVELQSLTPTNAYQEITETRTAGQSLIGAVEITSTSGGDVVIDDLTFGYSGAGFAGSTDDIACLVADNQEFVCVLTDPVTGNLVAAASGTVQVANTNEVSGSGALYGVPGSVLPDGKTVTNLTVSGGTVSEGNTLDLTVDAAGTTSTVATTFDAIYDRGSDLATVEAAYMTFDIFGDPSSFNIDASGAITGQSNAACVLNGQVSIIDAAFNAYDVTLDVTSCGGLDGMYDGLGSTADDTGMDDVFVFAVFTAQSTIVGEAVK